MKFGSGFWFYSKLKPKLDFMLLEFVFKSTSIFLGGGYSKLNINSKIKWTPNWIRVNTKLNFRLLWKKIRVNKILFQVNCFEELNLVWESLQSSNPPPLVSIDLLDTSWKETTINEESNGIWRLRWLIEDSIRSQRRNRLGQEFVDRLVHTHVNLNLEQRPKFYETGMFPWDIEMTVEEPLSDEMGSLTVSLRLTPSLNPQLTPS
jgi:hypothetical protein